MRVCVCVCVCVSGRRQLGHTLVTQGRSMRPPQLLGKHSYQLRSQASSLSHRRTRPARCPPPPTPPARPMARDGGRGAEAAPHPALTTTARPGYRRPSQEPSPTEPRGLRVDQQNRAGDRGSGRDGAPASADTRALGSPGLGCRPLLPQAPA